MAAIGEIRKRSWLLVAVIIIGMLAFILGGTLSGAGGSVEQSVIGTVNEKNITSLEYQELVEKEFNKTNIAYNALYGQPAPNSLKNQLNESYLIQYLNKKMFKAEYDKIGITVSDEEFNDLIQGNSVDGKVYQDYGLFVDNNKQFSPDTLKKLFPLAIQKEGFSFFLENVIGEQMEQSRLQKKYFGMITKGIYVTTFEAKKEFENNNNKVSFDFVVADYSSVSEEDISVSESDYIAYFNKHKNEEKYKLKDLVSFDFIEFGIDPSEEDKDIAKSYLDTKVELFKKAENDTAFILRNSETDNLTITDAKFPSEYDTIFQSLDTGDVVGPYLDGEYYKIAKIVEVVPVNEAKVRHILLSDSKFTDNKEGQKSLADSIQKLLETDKSQFEELMNKFSNDPASFPNKGVYDWFDDKKMVPEFTEVSFNKPINSISQAKTEYGIHIVEVLGRRTKKFKVMTVDSEIRRSKETILEVKNKATDFIILFNESKVSDSAFRNEATKLGLTINKANNISIEQRDFPQFKSNFELAKKWAFKPSTKVGNISEEILSEKVVAVSRVTNKSVAGEANYDNLSEQLKNDIQFEVQKEKKAEFLKNKLQGSSLEEIAKAIGNTVQTATDLTMNTNTLEPIGSAEPIVVGSAFGLENNTVSKPIAGNRGVFVVQVKNIVTEPLPESLEEIKTITMQRKRAQINSPVYQALKKATNLEDNREKVNILGK